MLRVITYECFAKALCYILRLTLVIPIQSNVTHVKSKHLLNENILSLIIIESCTILMVC